VPEAEAHPAGREVVRGGGNGPQPARREQPVEQHIALEHEHRRSTLRARQRRDRPVRFPAAGDAASRIRVRPVDDHSTAEAERVEWGRGVPHATLARRAR
jgi:hypothetical protein